MIKYVMPRGSKKLMEGDTITSPPILYPRASTKGTHHWQGTRARGATTGHITLGWYPSPLPLQGPA